MNETVAARATDQVSIEIDGVAMQAPKGSMIIEAADKAGITIPRFCYHGKLSIAANCRMCLVDVEKAPKPLPACATPVMDGMKVYTQSKRAQSAQQNVMEFLLINHPLDCPICDQGGECELQDISMGFGRSASRFSERKRVVKDENLGPLISTDMTRCIHCTRCVRFLDELAGTDELGGMGRGENTFISTFVERSIDSELSGNIIDLCPVGALTNKPFRFSARAWELRARTAIANHDAVGSNQYIHSKHGRALRAVPRDNEAVNENWLSDRDRWGWHGLQANDRAKRCQVKNDGVWQDVSWDVAFDRTAKLLKSVAAADLGFLLSPRSSDEELYLAQKLGRGLACGNIDHRLRIRDFGDQDELPLRPQFERPMAQLSHSDAILLVGSHIRHDQPILGLKLRQAWRHGGRIFAVNPRDYDFHFELQDKLILKPSAMVQGLAAVAKALGVSGGALGRIVADAQADATAQAIASGLRAGQRPTLLFGNSAVEHGQASLLRALARAIAEKSGAAFCEVPNAANSAGAWTVGAVPHRGPGGQRATLAGRNAQEMLTTALKVYVVYDFEPSLDTQLGAAALNTLRQADAVIYIGAFASPEVLDFADLVLPLAVAPEVEGSFTNLDGLVQTASAACQAPGEARPGWKILRVLGNQLRLDGFEYTSIEQVREEIGSSDASPAIGGSESKLAAPQLASGDGFEVLSETPIYSSNGVLRRSLPLQRSVHAERGSVRLHPDEISRLKLADLAQVTVQTADVTIQLPLVEDIALPLGTIGIPAGVPATAALASARIVEVRP